MSTTDLFPSPYYERLVGFQRTPRTHDEATAKLDVRHRQLVITIGNLLDMAERRLAEGDVAACRDLMAEARPYIAERDKIEGLWVA